MLYANRGAIVNTMTLSCLVVCVELLGDALIRGVLFMVRCAAPRAVVLNKSNQRALIGVEVT